MSVGRGRGAGDPLWDRGTPVQCSFLRYRSTVRHSLTVSAGPRPFLAQVPPLTERALTQEGLTVHSVLASLVLSDQPTSGSGPWFFKGLGYGIRPCCG